jgi:protein tyrosine/serine phosphatase
MLRYLPHLLGTLIAAMLVGGPVGYAYYQQTQIRNFRVVRDGVLYRSGQMSLAGLKRVIHDYGIRTVITLRDTIHLGTPPPDLEEEEYCIREEINYCRISPQVWWSADGSVPAEGGVVKFRKVMADPANYPVLVHCFAGIHRTGAFCAIYRMEYEHWSNAQAIEELKAGGYTNLEDEWDLLGYLEQYCPTWRASSPRPEAVESTAVPLRAGKRPRQCVP